MAQWEDVLAAGDRYLFAYRILKARLELNVDQHHFGEPFGVPQQTISDWERGVRIRVSTDMLFLGAKVVHENACLLMARPEDVHSEVGRVYWLAVAAELSAVTRGTRRPTVKDVLAAAKTRGSGT